GLKRGCLWENHSCVFLSNNAVKPSYRIETRLTWLYSCLKHRSNNAVKPSYRIETCSVPRLFQRKIFCNNAVKSCHRIKTKLHEIYSCCIFVLVDYYFLDEELK
ncbi:MAG: hypothetical protein OEZ01_17700, partial [Candidatus Heimdallarchaeota archaeon]|nr:hypothetical protein [Candidatus Heimdallarchaeota archaeon]